MSDPFTDQAEAAAREVARAHLAYREGKDNDTPVPQAAHDAIARWMAGEVTAACPHLRPDAPQPMVGYLAAPGLLYCLDCGATVASVYSAAPCDLCGQAFAVHGLAYLLGEVGHLVGQCCDDCIGDA